jgi:hypothetical protein
MQRAASCRPRAALSIPAHLAVSHWHYAPPPIFKVATFGAPINPSLGIRARMESARVEGAKWP